MDKHRKGQDRKTQVEHIRVWELEVEKKGISVNLNQTQEKKHSKSNRQRKISNTHMLLKGYFRNIKKGYSVINISKTVKHGL